MEAENRQPWLLIAIAGLGLALGVIALIVAFNAKSASDDAATQDSVDSVQTELSNLVDRLGIAEKTLTGEQESANGTVKRAARESRNAVINLSNRLDKVERETASLQGTAKQTATLTKEVGSLEHQVQSLDTQVAAVNQRVTKLSKRVNSASASGGASAP